MSQLFFQASVRQNVKCFYPLRICRMKICWINGIVNYSAIQADQYGTFPQSCDSPLIKENLLFKSVVLGVDRLIWQLTQFRHFSTSFFTLGQILFTEKNNDKLWTKSLFNKKFLLCVASIKAGLQFAWMRCVSIALRQKFQVNTGFGIWGKQSLAHTSAHA